MYRRDDPRFRRTLNEITTTFEHSAENAQIGLFSFNEHYLKPCFGSISESLQPCLQSFVPCLNTCASTLDPCMAVCFRPRNRSRSGTGHDRRGVGVGGPRRGRPRSRLEHSFDFYDDWAAEENDALLALDDDEFDRVVGPQEVTPDSAHGSDGFSGDAAYLRAARAAAARSSNAHAQQPGRRRLFTYGSSGPGGGAINLTDGVGGPSDPTVIPNQSYFGFLSKLPFNLGQRPGLRYKPSAADLQVRSKGGRFSSRSEPREGELDEEDEEDEQRSRWTGGIRHGRQRSGTQNSRETTDSFSSRGDLFPSDEEDDAVPLDDEFTLPLERARSGEDGSSGKRPSITSRKSTKSTQSGNTLSVESAKRKRPKRGRKDSKGAKSDSSTTPKSEIDEPEMGQVPTLEDLKLEERKAQEEEEAEVEQNRAAARKMAVEKGLVGEDNEVVDESGDVQSQEQQQEQHDPPLPTAEAITEGNTEVTSPSAETASSPPSDAQTTSQVLDPGTTPTSPEASADPNKNNVTRDGNG